MNPDQFPTNQNRIIAKLERRVADLEALVRQAKGTPIVRASGAFILPSASAPDPAAGEVGIYSAGGSARWVSDGGQDYSLMPRPAGSGVRNPAYNLTNATPTYTPGQVQTIVDTLDNLHASYLELLSSLRGSGRIP